MNRRTRHWDATLSTCTCAERRRKDLKPMPSNPKSNEQKMNAMINAWETLASAKSFGGMTLDQFKTVTTPAQSARARIADLESQMTQAINDRDTADAAFLVKAQ